MAVGKKKVIVYTDWIIQFKDLTNEEAGKLIKHFFNYINDLKPESDRLTELLFNPIKATLKRDLQSWESKQQTNKENGLKGGRPKKEITEINPNNPNGFLITQNNPEKGVSDSDSVSVSVNDKKDNISAESIDFGLLLNIINETFSRKYKIINDNVKAKFKARLKDGYTKEDIKNCIDNLKNITYHKDNGYQYCTPEFISRSETLEKYSIKTAQTKLSGEDEYMNNIMKQVNANKLL